MNKNIWIVLAVVIIVITGISIANSKKETGDIKIGAILNLTGTFSALGENSKDGIDLAIGEINNNGGVLGRKLTVDYQDNDGDNPKGALNALYNLTGKNIRLIIGTNLAPSGNVVAPVTEKADVVMISPSLGSEKFAEMSPRTFNLYSANKFGSFALAEYLYKDRGYKKIAILGSKQEWENDQALFVKQRFEELGGTITALELPLVDNKDLRAEAIKIKSSGPDAIVFTNYGETGISAKRLRGIGATQPFYSVSFYEPQIGIAEGALEGAVFVTTDTVSPDFNKKFQAVYHKDYATPASQAYDAIYFLKEGVEKAKSTNPKQVAEALSKIKEFKGFSGDITFDADGNSHKPILYYLIKNSKITPLEK